MSELNDKVEEATITNEEHAELLRLTKLAEKMQAERLQAVIDLARLRRVAPEELMRQLEIGP